MKTTRLLITLGAFALFFAGVLASGGANTAEAQDRNEAEIQQAWEVTHGAYGSNSFYVIKHNRITGETRVLDARSGSENDAWRTPMTIPPSAGR